MFKALAFGAVDPQRDPSLWWGMTWQRAPGALGLCARLETGRLFRLQGTALSFTHTYCYGFLESWRK